MRIIAGDLKGRRLTSPKNDKVRPTSDKVKEAIFSIVAGAYVDGNVMDLFAGTGNLGLEAISRGAKHCYFGDISKESLALVKENVRYCRVENQCTIFAGDYQDILDRISVKMDVIFLDPPYKDGLLENCISIISDREILSEDGYIVAEHDIREELPEHIGRYEKLKVRRYGKIGVSIYG